MVSEHTAERPAVSVVVPFYGDHEAGARVVEAMGSLKLRGGDELVIVDNTPGEELPEPGPGDVYRRVEAKAEQSSYYARNVGGDSARNDWILFVDADCRPRQDLLDRYFANPISGQTGILAGRVVADPRQGSVFAAYTESRRMLDSTSHSDVLPTPVGVTANLAVRRAAWAEVGGFQEGIKSFGDSEFCWRVQEAGWSLEHVPAAVVEHTHRESARALFRQCARYGAGAAWLNRRRPGSSPVPKPARGLVRCAAGVVVWTLALRPRRAAFKAIDAVSIAGTTWGYLRSNVPEPKGALRPTGDANGDSPTVIMADTFPVLSETFVVEEAHALRELGVPVRVEAIGRHERPCWSGARGIRVDYVEDGDLAGRLFALVWLTSRHPLGVVRDFVSRRRWPCEDLLSLVSLAPVARRAARNGDRHLHVHFACASAVSAARISRLIGVSYSVTAHAFDIFREPRALPEKLAGAAFLTTGCEYNARHLREEVMDGASGPPVRKQIMGVDGERFRRTSPLPDGGLVLAVGRLVEKKGFRDLVAAAADPRVRGAAERIVIVGDGPERGALEKRSRESGLGGLVELVGWRDPGQVRDLLEGASLLVMPSVVGADGDRDSMPVVVKEALAMEVAVVASDEVGLPEVVEERWGRLVPPRDPPSLAAAIADVLCMPHEERVEMGRAGREFVLENCDVGSETEKLAGWIREAVGRRPPAPSPLRARPSARR